MRIHKIFFSLPAKNDNKISIHKEKHVHIYNGRTENQRFVLFENNSSLKKLKFAKNI